SLADRSRAPATATGMPGDGGAIREGLVGAGRRRERRLRLPGHGRRTDRRVPASRGRRNALLDELRRVASGARAALHGALRPRGHAAVPLSRSGGLARPGAVTSSCRLRRPPRPAQARRGAREAASGNPGTRRGASRPRQPAAAPWRRGARTSSEGPGTPRARAWEAPRPRPWELHDEVLHRHFGRLNTRPIAFVKAPTVNGFWSSGPSFGASTDAASVRYPET